MNDVRVIEYRDIRVLTTQQLAEAYGTDVQVVTNNFNRNKDRYHEGEHYICLTGGELRDYRAKNQNDVLPNANKLYLWTEKGAFLHAKSLNTDTAWEVYDRLVESYFQKARPRLDSEALSPELQMFLKMGEAMARQEIEQKRLATQVEAHEKAIDGIRDAVMPVTDNWREEMQRKFNHIQHNCGVDFRALRAEMYAELDRQAGTDIGTRLRNRKERMMNDGHTKTAVNSLNKMDIIESDKKLREIFAKIVAEYEIRYCA